MSMGSVCSWSFPLPWQQCHIYCRRLSTRLQRKRSDSKFFLESVPSTRIWLVTPWQIIHFIGLREVLTISLCGYSLLSIRFGSTTNCLANNRALLLCNYWPIPSHIIETFYDVTLGFALSLFWNQNCIMTINYLNGISKHAKVIFGVFRWSFSSCGKCL